MNYSHEATYCRTALLLGLVRGDFVLHWAGQIIERDPEPPPALFDVISIPARDLSALRHALWPLVIEPDPPPVLEAILGQLHRELASGVRTMTDTLTIVRQIRSMVKLPPELYAALNAALVVRAEDPESGALQRWLQQFAHAVCCGA